MITVQLESKDIEEAYKLNARWGPWMWFYAFVPTVLCVGLAFWMIISDAHFQSMGITLIVFMVMFWILLAYVKSILPCQIARRQFKQQKRFRRTSHLSWDDLKLSTESETGVGHSPWTDFFRWRENKYAFLLYLSRGLFIIVPKKAFSDTRDILDFGQVLRQRIGKEGNWRRNINGKERAGFVDSQ